MLMALLNGLKLVFFSKIYQIWFNKLLFCISCCAYSLSILFFVLFLEKNPIFIIPTSLIVFIVIGVSCCLWLL